MEEERRESERGRERELRDEEEEALGNVEGESSIFLSVSGRQLSRIWKLFFFFFGTTTRSCLCSALFFIIIYYYYYYLNSIFFVWEEGTLYSCSGIGHIQINFRCNGAPGLLLLFFNIYMR